MTNIYIKLDKINENECRETAYYMEPYTYRTYRRLPDSGITQTTVGCSTIETENAKTTIGIQNVGRPSPGTRVKRKNETKLKTEH